VSVYERFGALRDPAAYLRRCVVNEANRRARRERLFGRVAPMLSRGEGVEDYHSDFVELIARLSRRQRTAVFLRYYLDLSEVDIAAVMRCRPGTVKSTLHTALRRLEEVLG
jgi:DNA-directed RNA polymerase specialized sigma24 family protein